MAIELIIHSTGSGQCSLSGKDAEGLTITFKDGTITEGFLSQKAFMQIVKMKMSAGQKAKPIQPMPAAPAPQPVPAVKPAAPPAGNAVPVAAK